MTIIRWRRFTIGQVTQTPKRYIFSESSRIVDYEDILNNKIFSKYSALFPKVQMLTKEVRLQSNLRERTLFKSKFIFSF